MINYEIYIFILCIFIFVVLTGFITFLILYIFSLRKKTILNGLEDEKIKKDYDKEISKKTKASRLVSNTLNAVVVSFFVVLFGASLTINISSKYGNNDFTMVRVVESNSMSKKDKDNSYLEENNLNDQFQMFDMIVTHKLPKEEELKLFDVVVYDQDGIDVIHRIIHIEEPNEKNPDCRHFVLRGDANIYSDRIPVLYSQMKAIYRGEKVQFVGSIFMFFKEPAGILCMILIAFTCIGAPILENKLDALIRQRLLAIGYIKEDEEQDENTLLRAIARKFIHEEYLKIKEKNGYISRIENTEEQDQYRELARRLIHEEYSKMKENKGK